MREFTCEECGRSFVGDRTDAEVRAEAEANGWGDIPDEDMATICDDCYRTLMGSLMAPPNKGGDCGNEGDEEGTPQG